MDGLKWSRAFYHFNTWRTVFVKKRHDRIYFIFGLIVKVEMKHSFSFKRVSCAQTQIWAGVSYDVCWVSGSRYSDRLCYSLILSICTIHVYPVNQQQVTKTLFLKNIQIKYSYTVLYWLKVKRFVLHLLGLSCFRAKMFAENPASDFIICDLSDYFFVTDIKNQNFTTPLHLFINKR